MGRQGNRPRFRPIHGSLLGSLHALTFEDDRPKSGSRWGSSSGGRGRGASAAERHNVARLPELDYFARKLDQSNDGQPGPKWDLPYAKAGRATSLPDSFSSISAYLDAMQAGAALEFQARRARPP